MSFSVPGKSTFEARKRRAKKNKVSHGFQATTCRLDRTVSRSVVHESLVPLTDTRDYLGRLKCAVLAACTYSVLKGDC